MQTPLKTSDLFIRDRCTDTTVDMRKSEDNLPWFSPSTMREPGIQLRSTDREEIPVTC